MKVIRTAKLTDSEEIKRLCTQLGYSVSIEQIKLRIERLTNDINNAIFVYQINDNLSGWVHVFGKYLIELEYAEIGGLVVDSNYRRQGIGLKLMNECKEWAIENNFKEIRLRSGGQRKGAHEFYKQIGYENPNWQELFIMKI